MAVVCYFWPIQTRLVMDVSATKGMAGTTDREPMMTHFLNIWDIVPNEFSDLPASVGDPAVK